MSIAAKRSLQLNDQGPLRHFLSLDGLPRDILTAIRRAWEDAQRSE